MATTDSPRATPETGAATQPPVGAVEALWNVRRTAAFLGVHPKTVHRWRRSHGLPCVVIGSRVRFRPSDVTKWVSARKEG